MGVVCVSRASSVKYGLEAGEKPDVVAEWAAAVGGVAFGGWMRSEATAERFGVE